MKIQEKPDYLIFADSAKKGEVSAFPDVSRGWGVTIDQTASKPPMEWMNGAFNRVDKNMLYLLQQGVPEWSDKVLYPVNAIVKYNGILYTAIAENENVAPSKRTTKWKKTQAEISNASTTQSGIVKLNSATDSTSETDAATPLAVKKANDLALSAVQKRGDTMTGNLVINNGDNSAIQFKNSAGQAWQQRTYADGSFCLERYDPGLKKWVKFLRYVEPLNEWQFKNDVKINGTSILNIIDNFTSGDNESRMYSRDKRFYLLMRDDGVVGMYDTVKKGFAWEFNRDGLCNGFIDASHILGLEQFIRDRSFPPGIPLPSPFGIPPTGYLECNGSSFDINSFPRLATAYPNGRLPDLRGEFIRGWDSGRGSDPFRPLLSGQGDAIRNITGTFKSSAGAFNQDAQSGAFALTDIRLYGPGYYGYHEHGLVDFNVSRVVPVADENRPRNVAFMYIVKAE
ncbi:phage tail protein [Gilliamella mensalis]|uniref:phage tail protein n=1 Tax=Gilliamella mensalis TaxID=1908520 RepID=UPI000A147D75|nr:tail fiber protein [Gilliamella mensalis]